MLEIRLEYRAWAKNFEEAREKVLQGLSILIKYIAMDNLGILAWNRKSLPLLIKGFSLSNIHAYLSVLKSCNLQIEYCRWRKTLECPTVPANPQGSYQEWKGWGNFLWNRNSRLAKAISALVLKMQELIVHSLNFESSNEEFQGLV